MAIYEPDAEQRARRHAQIAEMNTNPYGAQRQSVSASMDTGDDILDDDLIPGGIHHPGSPGPTTPPQPPAEPPAPPSAPVKEATAVDSFTPPPPPAPQQPMFQNPVPSSYVPPGPAAPAPAQYKAPPITDEVTKILMARLKELQNPGDLANDPHYQQAIRAYQVGQMRSADKQRKALAERTAATGGTTRSGGFNVGVRGIQERAGENAAQYQSGLALDRLQAREQQLTQAIQMARAVGQDEIANQLELQRLQLQAELGRGDLALRGELGRGQLGLGYDNLGFSYADLISRRNAEAVRAGGGF